MGADFINTLPELTLFVQEKLFPIVKIEKLLTF